MALQGRTGATGVSGRSSCTGESPFFWLHRGNASSGEPGDGGGPLVNDRAELVAVVSHRGSPVTANMVNSSIDIREVRQFLDAHFQSFGQKWHDVPSMPLLPITGRSSGRPRAPSSEPAIKRLDDKDPAVRLLAL